MNEATFPAVGAVLGIDIGCSPVRRSSAICRLDWTETTLDWTIRRFRATDAERADAITAIADRPLLAAALDGPLAPSFGTIGHYRRAEQMLTRGFQPLIGKPGQSSTPVGRALNHHANLCAMALAAGGRIGPGGHAHAIDRAAIVEAFPSAFLGMLIEEPAALGARRHDRSDLFYRHLAQSGVLDALAAHLLPGRAAARSFASVTNHDDRAALVCALTALGVAKGDYRAVGDEADGWIILPPPVMIHPWAHTILTRNEADGQHVPKRWAA